jgi:2-polyprenyl-3-methyl-5-hydroxy-6-metoxy-1,4-benzoquinol methylase
MQIKRKTIDASRQLGGKELGGEYDPPFFENHAAGSRNSAAVVVPLVNKLVQPKSVLDVGCGVGTWLSEWADQGVTDFLGLDGELCRQGSVADTSNKFQVSRSPESVFPRSPV